MITTRPRSLATLLLVVGMLTASGCGQETVKAPAKPFNTADTTFVIDAGSHLGKTVTAARTATERASDPHLRQLARTIVKTQGAHTDSLAGWLNAWGKQGAPFDHGDVPHDDAPSNGAGFTDESITRLTNVPRAQFERLFARLLLEHLNAGRTIWQTEIADGRHAGAVKLARTALKQQNRQRAAVEGLGDRQ